MLVLTYCICTFFITFCDKTRRRWFQVYACIFIYTNTTEMDGVWLRIGLVIYRCDLPLIFAWQCLKKVLSMISSRLYSLTNMRACNSTHTITLLSLLQTKSKSSFLWQLKIQGSKHKSNLPLLCFSSEIICKIVKILLMYLTFQFAVPFCTSLQVKFTYTFTL